MARRTKQDHWNYTLRDGRLVVKHGITTDPCERFTQMENMRTLCRDISPIMHA